MASSYTSWGTRKALGRRYAVDPAQLLEEERLRREYDLAPGREARGLQASQFDRQMAFNREQADLNRAGSEKAGMIGTLGNVATTGMMLRTMYGGKSAPAPVAPTATTAQPTVDMSGWNPITNTGKPTNWTVSEGVNPATTDVSGFGIGEGAAAGMGETSVPAISGYGAGEEAAAGLTGASTATGAESSMMTGASAVAIPAAIVGAAELAKGQWGQLDRGWDDKSATGRLTSSPGTLAGTGMIPTHLAKEGTFVSNVGRELARIEQKVLAPIDAILGIKNPAGGTWLCTATKRHVGMDPKERQAIRKLRRYAKQNHPEDLFLYQEKGCCLVEEIARRENDLPQFYEGIKACLVSPVVRLVTDGELELAFMKYKSETVRLFNQYMPDFEIGEVE